MKTFSWLASLLVVVSLMFLFGRGCEADRNDSGPPDGPGSQPAELPAFIPRPEDPAAKEFEVKVTRIEAANRYLVRTIFGNGRAGIDTPCLIVYLKYENHSEGKRYTSNGWPSGQLSDEQGNRYRMLSDDHLLRPDKMPPILRPGESIADVMVFEAPIAQASMLRLYVQDHFSADSGVARGAVEISIPVEEILDPEKVIR